jgi:hypothetical protein
MKGLPSRALTFLGKAFHIDRETDRKTDRQTDRQTDSREKMLTLLPNDFLNWKASHRTKEDKGSPLNGLDLIGEWPTKRQKKERESE